MVRRQKNIYTNVHHTQKPSFLSVICKTFIGSSLILYGVIMILVMLISQRYVIAILFGILPFFGIKILKRKNIDDAYERTSIDFDSL